MSLSAERRGNILLKTAAQTDAERKTAIDTLERRKFQQEAAGRPVMTRDDYVANATAQRAYDNQKLRDSRKGVVQMSTADWKNFQDANPTIQKDMLDQYANRGQRPVAPARSPFSTFVGKPGSSNRPGQLATTDAPASQTTFGSNPVDPFGGGTSRLSGVARGSALSPSVNPPKQVSVTPAAPAFTGAPRQVGQGQSTPRVTSGPQPPSTVGSSSVSSPAPAAPVATLPASAPAQQRVVTPTPIANATTAGGAGGVPLANGVTVTRGMGYGELAKQLHGQGYKGSAQDLFKQTGGKMLLQGGSVSINNGQVTFGNKGTLGGAADFATGRAIPRAVAAPTPAPVKPTVASPTPTAAPAPAPVAAAPARSPLVGNNPGDAQRAQAFAAQPSLTRSYAMNPLAVGASGFRAMGTIAQQGPSALTPSRAMAAAPAPAAAPVTAPAQVTNPATHADTLNNIVKGLGNAARAVQSVGKPPVTATPTPGTAPVKKPYV